jgi:hypothetical protein
VSGALRHRSRRRRLLLRLVALAAFGVATAALAAGLQVHEIRITGVSRFPVAQIESALRFALGTPTVAARAEMLRDAVRGVPWVADARLGVSIDGVVTCAVVERRPAAVAVDGASRLLVDAEGALLGTPRGDDPTLELRGFGADTEGRATVVAAAGAVESLWGARLLSAERLGPRDVLLHFADSSCAIVVDPARPEGIELARRVLTAWSAQVGAAPLRIDARVRERVAVTPAAPTPTPAPTQGTVT